MKNPASTAYQAPSPSRKFENIPSARHTSALSASSDSRSSLDGHIKSHGGSQPQPSTSSSGKLPSNSRCPSQYANVEPKPSFSSKQSRPSSSSSSSLKPGNNHDSSASQPQTVRKSESRRVSKSLQPLDHVSDRVVENLSHSHAKATLGKSASLLLDKGKNQRTSSSKVQPPLSMASQPHELKPPLYLASQPKKVQLSMSSASHPPKVQTPVNSASQPPKIQPPSSAALLPRERASKNAFEDRRLSQTGTIKGQDNHAMNDIGPTPFQRNHAVHSMGQSLGAEDYSQKPSWALQQAAAKILSLSPLPQRFSQSTSAKNLPPVQHSNRSASSSSDSVMPPATPAPSIPPTKRPASSVSDNNVIIVSPASHTQNAPSSTVNILPPPPPLQNASSAISFKISPLALQSASSGTTSSSVLGQTASEEKSGVSTNKAVEISVKPTLSQGRQLSPEDIEFAPKPIPNLSRDPLKPWGSEGVKETAQPSEPVCSSTPEDSDWLWEVESDFELDDDYTPISKRRLKKKKKKNDQSLKKPSSSQSKSGSLSEKNQIKYGPRPVQFVCAVCGKGYKVKWAYDQHISKSLHGGDEQLALPIAKDAPQATLPTGLEAPSLPKSFESNAANGGDEGGSLEDGNSSCSPNSNWFGLSPESSPSRRSQSPTEKDGAHESLPEPNLSSNGVNGKDKGSVVTPQKSASSATPMEISENYDEVEHRPGPQNSDVQEKRIESTDIVDLTKKLSAMEAVLNLIVDTQLNQAHSRTSPGLDLISSKLDQLFSKLDNISSKNEQLSSRIDTLYQRLGNAEASLAKNIPPPPAENRPMLTEILTFINRLEIKLGSMVPHVLPPAESQPTLTEVLSSVNHLETKLGSLVSNAAKTVETLEERLGLLEEPEENVPILTQVLNGLKQLQGSFEHMSSNAKRMYDAHEDRIDVLEEHVNAPLADSKNDALVGDFDLAQLLFDEKEDGGGSLPVKRKRQSSGSPPPENEPSAELHDLLINKEVFEDLDRGLLSFEDSFNEIGAFDWRAELGLDFLNLSQAESQVGDAIGEAVGTSQQFLNSAATVATEDSSPAPMPHPPNQMKMSQKRQVSSLAMDGEPVKKKTKTMVGRVMSLFQW